MAILSSAELQKIRQNCASAVSVTYVKSQLNAAAQATETWISENAAAVSSVIDNATAPLTLTVAQKKRLFAEVVRAKYERDIQ